LPIPAGRILPHAYIYTIGDPARLGTRKVGARNGQVIAKIGKIKIILNRQGDRFAQRKIELSVDLKALEPR